MDRIRTLRHLLIATVSLGLPALFASCSRSDESWPVTHKAGTPPATAPAAAQVQVAKAAPSEWELFSRDVGPFFTKDCASCHGGDSPESGVLLEGFTDAAVVEKRAHVLTHALQMLRQHKMPPSEKRQPSAEELKPVLA